MNNSEQNPTAPRPQADNGTYTKVQKHISDINDVISEDDIRNVKVDIAPMNADEAVIGADRDDEEVEKEHEEARKINSTWNVIGE